MFLQQPASGLYVKPKPKNSVEYVPDLWKVNE